MPNTQKYFYQNRYPANLIQKRLLILISLVIILFNPSTASANPTQNIFGTWNSFMASGDFGKLSPDLKKFRWLIMDQVRTRDDSSKGSRFSENLLWLQSGYQINDYASIWLGYTHNWIELLDNSSLQESRPYQDLLINVPFFDSKILSRTRFEQRILHSNASLGLRLREWLQISHPVSFISDDLSIYAGDEVLFYLNRSVFGINGFAENRVLAGFMYNFNAHWGADLGYMGQYVVRENTSDLFTHNIALNFRYSF